LEVNAGHDLSLANLKFFKENIPQLAEVSIGHALVSDTIYFGLENTIQQYLFQLNS
jgi:pyridoxine 5-phosphate synthase